MKVLIAIEPRSYREVIGLTIEELRPHVWVEVVEPGNLQSEVSRMRPDLVFCGGPDPGTRLAGTGARAWVEFQPYAETQATVCLGDECSEIEDVDLDDILALVDAVERLIENPLAPKNCGTAARGQRRSAIR